MSKPIPVIPEPLIDTLEYLHDHVDQTKRTPSFAPHDLSISIDFLSQYDGSKGTFDSYRKEVERLLQWTWLVANKSILDLNRQEFTLSFDTTQSSTTLKNSDNW